MSSPNTDVSRAKSRLATLSRKAVKATPDEISAARADLAAAKIEAAIQNALANAPKLTDARRQRIVALLLAGGDAA